MWFVWQREIQMRFFERRLCFWMRYLSTLEDNILTLTTVREYIKHVWKAQSHRAGRETFLDFIIMWKCILRHICLSLESFVFVLILSLTLLNTWDSLGTARGSFGWRGWRRWCSAGGEAAGGWGWGRNGSAANWTTSLASLSLGEQNPGKKGCLSFLGGGSGPQNISYVNQVP